MTSENKSPFALQHSDDLLNDLTAYQSAKKSVAGIGKPPYELPHPSAFLNFEAVAPCAAEQNVYLNCFQFGVIVYSETPDLSFSFVPCAFVSDGMPLYAFESVHVLSRYGISCQISAALGGSSVAALGRLHAAAVDNFKWFLAKEQNTHD